MPEEVLFLSSEPKFVSLDDLTEEIEIEEDAIEAGVVPIGSDYPLEYYGADFTMVSLAKKMQQGEIYIPEFQRNYVWNIKNASHFIESLLLGLPIPSIFLATEPDTNNLLVIDGNQRLKTLEYFYTGIFEPTGAKFKLTDVQQKFMNATYNSLPVEDRRQLDESILHAIIVKQNTLNSNNIYLLFERLNTGGTALTPQEIRAGIYHGHFREVLKELNTNKSWRAIYNQSSIPDNRLQDEELILRFMALLELHQVYRKPMKNFLNNYMKNNQKEEDRLNTKKELFIKAIELIYCSVGNNAFRIRKNFNVAVFDAVMVGLATRIINSGSMQEEAVRKVYENILHNQEFLSFVETDKPNDNNAVKGRINLAIKAFAEIG